MKPIIGISSNLANVDTGNASIYERITLRETYVNAIEKAGGVPLVIPVNSDIENIKRQVELMDGILLSGGDDINPILYNEEPMTNLGYVHPCVDECDMNLVKIAIELNKPIFGICRGLQVINVYFGGSLYQDLGYRNNIKHMQNTKPYLGTHTIKIAKESKLYKVFGESAVVNSYHHQSIKDLGNKLVAIAVSRDNVIEAIQLESELFVLGVQWHPEYMIDNCDKMLELFKLFVNECNK